jgi:non-ribosomal peptide synthetase component E (peptide arylation enzyme)
VTNLAALLFDVASRLPDRPAVSDDRSSRTYRELTERVARLAGGLRRAGPRAGRPCSLVNVTWPLFQIADRR